jgi:hypothetical protein
MENSFDEDVWLRFFSSLGTLLGDYVETLQCRNASTQADMCESLGRYIRGLSEAIESVADLANNNGIPEALINLRLLLQHLLNLKSELVAFSGIRACTEVAVVYSERMLEEPVGVGRPRFYVDREQVQYLLSMGFNISTVCKMMSVSRATMWRRLQQWNVERHTYSNLTDEELRVVVSEIYSRHVNCGVRMMMGHLRSRGIRVQRYKVREILREIDPANSALRWGLAIKRRVYSVPSANSLWHIDTHHALIRWRLVTAGGIDGYSRLVVFLTISDNNRSDTVLELFRNAACKFGLPSRVRGDRGVENFGVRDYMEHSRGANRGSFIAGKSCHNQRVERLWRDVMYSVIQTFYSLFYYLESVFLLDVDNEIDLFCLHMVYIPVINKALHEFQEAYNNHPLSSARNWTPGQLWCNSILELQNRQSAHIQEILQNGDINNYGIDPHGPIPEEDGTEGVVVSRTPVPVHGNDLAMVYNIINNGDTTDNFSIPIYSTVRRFVYSCL